jgi:hypothetical protein
MIARANRNWRTAARLDNDDEIAERSKGFPTVQTSPFIEVRFSIKVFPDVRSSGARLLVEVIGGISLCRIDVGHHSGLVALLVKAN